MSICDADVSESDDHDEELDAAMNVQQLMGKCKMLIDKHKKVKQKQKEIEKELYGSIGHAEVGVCKS